MWQEPDGARCYRCHESAAAAPGFSAGEATCLARPSAEPSAPIDLGKPVAGLLNPPPFPQIAELRVRVRIKPWLHGLRMSHNAKRAPSWSAKSRR
ncbi:hypothetical protein CBM2589_B220181 [Cupriavidus taiwanensis]|uniref:Uncharacterized protein n=1 Tax=Cupriavidus taiwanensis TaxID=164546 RepID=A0A976A0H0_9BURK|nr:hypothetical protein CBM2589_B220181 [Cupriavidus taiwanensis]